MNRSPLFSLLDRLRRSLEAEAGGSLSDAELLDRWLDQRDQAAFEALVWRLGPLVLGVCRRVLQRPEEIEDAFQAAFLILIRKATGIHRRGSLSSWMYQVAYRVALRLRASRNRREKQEQPAVEEPAVPAVDDLLWRDLRPILDQEVGRLPERYRITFVLCYLQGKTNAEAARELGCPVGTVLSRLAWARERLRDRLGRRGVTLTVAALLGTLGRSVADAAPARNLVVTATQLPEGEVPPAAASLAQGVIRTMTLTRLKVVAVVVGCLGLLGVGGGMYYQTQAQTRGHEAAAIMIPVLAARAPVPEKRTLEVPSEVDGIVRVIGVPVSKQEEEAVKPEQRQRFLKEGKWLQGSIGYLMVEEPNPQKYPAKELLTFPDAPEKKYRLRKKEEQLKPGMIRVELMPEMFRKLKVGDRVEEGQLIALVDSRLALDELEVKVAKFEAADAERLAAETTRNEAKRRYEAMLATARRVQGAISPDEMRAAELTWQRYIQEEVAKRAALRQVDREVNAALTQLRRHEIRSPVAGVIRKIYKQRGEAVKALESVFQIEFEEDN